MKLFLQKRILNLHLCNEIQKNEILIQSFEKNIDKTEIQFQLFFNATNLFIILGNETKNYVICIYKNIF